MIKRILYALLSFNLLFNEIQTFIPNISSAYSQKSKKKETNLSKFELSGLNKKNWSQRLQWFESKIINYYKNLNKSNILVVGDQNFLDLFKSASKNKGWNSKFTYSNVPSKENYDLIIDAKYNPKHFKSIYGNKNVSSFKDVYSEILFDETLSFLKNNGVKYYFFDFPHFDKLVNPDDIDKKFIGKKPFKLRKNKEFLNLLYGDNPECREYIENFLQLCTPINNGKYYTQKDVSSKLYNVSNGIRKTAYDPNLENAKKIWIYGPCITVGTYVSDSYTIASFLQKKINNDSKPYRMLNCGAMGGTDYINTCEYILNTMPTDGDLVISIQGYDKVLGTHNIKLNDFTSIFNRPHSYGHWILDMAPHPNHNGNKAIADYIYKTIERDLNNNESKKRSIKYKFENEVDTFLEENPEFKQYLDNLKKIRDENNIKGKIGAIVMNCNPFTLGHRYLIDQSLSKVDHLYIFVVEEDKSVFPFKDRIDLVKKGVSDLGDKVTVLPSGKWMISLLTFPEYFSKDSLQEAAIDPSKDVTLFGKYICPSLNITQRFAGEEPTDSVTRQYNNSMKSILPKYGIQFNEIPRKLYDNDNVISASKVRKIVKNGSYNLSDKQIIDLKQYVPDSTLDYLKQNCKLLVDKLK